MKTVYHLNIIASKEDRDELNRVGWDGHPRFTMHADITCGDAKAAAAAYSEGFYKQVATIDGSLEDAFAKTQNIDKPWDPMGIHRSTSVGDIVKDETGGLHLVAPIGFERIA